LKYPVLTQRRHNPLLHRICPHCAARMWLAVIEPLKPGEDRLVFECTECGREELVEVKANGAA
jgi:hypothetical protein